MVVARKCSEQPQQQEFQHQNYRPFLLHPAQAPNGRRGSLQSSAGAAGFLLQVTSAGQLQGSHSALTLMGKQCHQRNTLMDKIKTSSNQSLSNSRKCSVSARAPDILHDMQRVPSQPALFAPVMRARVGTSPRARRVLTSQNSLGSPKLQARLHSATAGGMRTPPGKTLTRPSCGGTPPPRKSSSPTSHHHHNNGSQQNANSGANSGASAPSPTIGRLLRRCPQSDLATRLQRNHLLLHDMMGNNNHSRGSSTPGSNDSTPTRATVEQESNMVDPVYLALKKATAKYGHCGNRAAGGRRGSHCVGMPSAMALDSGTPSPGNLSQVSLLDSGTYSGSELCGSSSRLPATGSTPHLNGNQSKNATVSGGTEQRRPKLSEKMKSLSLDCPPTATTEDQNIEASSEYGSKAPPTHHARAYAYATTYADSFDQCESSATRRRLPPVPVTAQLQAAEAIVISQKQLHIVTHEYHSGGAECTLHPGDRLVVMDNGDPDWKHGFKVNDRQEQLLTFPSTCVAGYRADEQPMRLVQTCNLADQKLRLYRDQIVFVQPNSLREDGHVMVRNEHDKVAHCPLQYLTLV